MQEALGKVDPLMVKAIGPMAGGSRVRSLCGALQAGVLTLGMLYGAEGEKLSSQEALVESFQPAIRFYGEFEKAFGSRNCHEIIHADLNNPEERQKWVNQVKILWEGSKKRIFLAPLTSGVALVWIKPVEDRSAFSRETRHFQERDRN